jgi:hypothetical protein
MKTKILKAFVAFFPALAISMNSFGSGNPGLPVEVKYAGKENYFSVVQVSIRDNNPLSQYIISVKNENGTVVYTEYVKAGSISQRFLFDTEELNDEAVTIEVRKRKSDEAVEYKISSLTTFTREITASKLK